MEPVDLLKKYKDSVFTIDGAQDARKKLYRQSALEKTESVKPEEIAIRYEPDTGYMYVDASWLSGMVDEDFNDLETKFKQNIQYKGRININMMKGTFHEGTSTRVHVFDLITPSAKRILGNDPGRITYRNNLMRKTRRDMPAVAKAMEAFDMLDPLIKRGKNDLELQRELNAESRKLLKEARRLALGLKPIQRAKKPRERLAQLDAYIVENKPSFDVKRTYLLVEANVPHLRHIDKPAPNKHTKGLFRESVNLDATNHKRRVHVVIKDLKKEVPNYGNDVRYVCSQSTYVRYVNERDEIVGTTMYCAVFDLKK